MSHKLQIPSGYLQFIRWEPPVPSLLGSRGDPAGIRRRGIPAPSFPSLLILEGSPPLPQRRSETEGPIKNAGTPQRFKGFFQGIKSEMSLLGETEG